jgi:hypothetical protein
VPLSASYIRRKVWEAELLAGAVVKALLPLFGAMSGGEGGPSQEGRVSAQTFFSMIGAKARGRKAR